MCIQSVRRGATQPIVAILLILMTTSLDSNEKKNKEKENERKIFIKYRLFISDFTIFFQMKNYL